MALRPWVGLLLLGLAHAAAAQAPAPGSPASAALGEKAETERERDERAGERRPGMLVDQWWLNEKTDVSFNRLTPHRPVYVIVRHSRNVNEQPTGTPRAEPDDDELKFQLSFRTEVLAPNQFWGGILENRLRLWFAYTQQSHWQVFDGDASRPFRETNYEPEAILSIDARETPSGEAPPSLRPALVNLGVVHQSNGRSEPESRTWWRLYGQAGWQLPWGSLLARAWHTVRESGMEQDNRDINDHVGRAELVFRTSGERFGHFLVLVRNNLRGGDNRAYLQVDWRSRGRVLVAPLHIQLTSGYGESLLDYNHRQTTLGVGFSFWDW